jgi:hypothetical protein
MTHWLVNHHITGHLVFVLVSTERVIMSLRLIIPAAAKFGLLFAFFMLKHECCGNPS